MNLTMPVMEVWVAAPGMECDNSIQPIGCIEGSGSLAFNQPMGTQIMLYIYNADGTCDSSGDYMLWINPVM